MITIVEFVGLPGSGKSSAARQISAIDPKWVSVVVRKTRPQDVAKRPLAVARQLANWNHLRVQWSDKKAFFTLLRFRIDHDRAIAEVPPMLLLEEGITHHVWRELYVSPTLRTQPWGPLLEGVHPLIALEADQETLRGRILGKLKRGSVNERLAAATPGGQDWQRAQDLYEEILVRAKRFRPVIRVDTSGSLVGSVNQIRDVIARHQPG
jgi:hypothetical protein